MSTKPTSVFIDIERMMAKQLKLQEQHVKKNPKDEAPKIKLRKQAAKIRALKKYAALQEAKKNNKK